MEIIKNFDLLSGISDDNILEFRNNTTSLGESTKTITFAEDIDRNDLEGTFIRFSISGQSGAQVEYLRVSLSDMDRYSSLPIASATFVASTLVQSQYFYDTQVTGNQVNFKCRENYSVEVISSSLSVLDKISLDSRYTTGTITIDDITYNRRLYSITTNADTYVTNELIISSDSLKTPVVLRKINVNDDSVVTFNLRDVLSKLDNMESMTLYMTLTMKSSAATAAIALDPVYALPSYDSMYNTDFSDYYFNEKSGGVIRLLTESSNGRRVVSGRKYTFSYISFIGFLTPKIEVYDYSGSKTGEVMVEGQSERGIIKDFTFLVPESGVLKVYLTDEKGEVVSHELSLEVFQSCNQFNEINFKNKLGGVDTVCMFSSYTINENISSQNTYSGSLKGQRHVIDKKVSSTLTMRTELLTPEEYEVYTSMCSSNNVWYDKYGERKDLIVTKYDASKVFKQTGYRLEFTLDDVNYVK